MSVIIIDDHGLFSAGLKGLYEALNDGVEVRTYPNCDAALGDVEDLDSIALVLLDYHIPDSDPERNLKVIRATFNSAKIVIVSGETDPRKVISAINQGASGFIPKAANSDTMVSALEIISAGGVYLPGEVNRFYSASLQSTEVKEVSADHPLAALTPSQRDVVELVINGLSNQAIADKRNASLSTIKNQLSAAFKELGVRNRAQLVLEVGRFYSQN